MSGLCVKLSELKATHQKTLSEIESIVQQSHELESLFPAFEPFPAPAFVPRILPGGMERIGRALWDDCALCAGYGKPCICSEHDELVDDQCIGLCRLCYCDESE